MIAVPRARFRPHEHLRNPRDFRRAFDRRKTASDDVLIVYAFPNGLDHARLGISVGKKKVKTAVGRNRIKRAIREAFRLNKSTIPAGVDYVVVPRGSVIPGGRARTSLPALARSAAHRVGIGGSGRS
jgi:ribonuclease P protein component